MRRNWLVAAIVIGLAAILIAALIVRLTRDESDDAKAWAGSVCSSVSDWRASILELADVQAGELDAETLGERIDDAEGATEELVSELRGLGPPELESGEALRLELQAIADSLRAEVDALREDAQEALAADSPVEFLQGLAALAPRFQRLLTGAAAVLERLETAPSVTADDRAELQQAFAEADACEELRGETEG